MILTMVCEVQVPLLATLLLGGCVSKVIRMLRMGLADGGDGPTALFPMRLRRPVAAAMCALELGLGVGLIATAGVAGGRAAAVFIRLGTGLLFLVAFCALLEMRSVRPEIGCGCFGELSTSPVSWRTLTRAALLAVAALGTLPLGPVSQPPPGWPVIMVGILAGELILIACLSPELGEALVRLGYSEPCERRVVPEERTLAALRRSKQWRRHARLLTTDEPTDIWRELCWRYVVFPGRLGDWDAEIVFGVFLGHRRPLIRAAMVDAATGNPLQWPAAPARPRWRVPSPLRHAIAAASPAAPLAGGGASRSAGGPGRLSGPPNRDPAEAPASRRSGVIY